MNYKDAYYKLKEYKEIYGVQDIDIALIFKEAESVPAGYNRGTMQNYDLAIGPEKNTIKVFNYDLNNKKNFINKYK